MQIRAKREERPLKTFGKIVDECYKLTIIGRFDQKKSKNSVLFHKKIENKY